MTTGHDGRVVGASSGGLGQRDRCCGFVGVKFTRRAKRAVRFLKNSPEERAANGSGKAVKETRHDSNSSTNVAGMIVTMMMYNVEKRQQMRQKIFLSVKC